MEYLKMFVLATVAVSALMASIGVGTASATVLCSTTAEPCPTTQKWGNVSLDFSIPSGSRAVVTATAGESIDSCTTSTVKGKITNPGSSTSTVTGPVEELTWSGCDFPTKTLQLGNLEVHKIAGTSNGTLTSDGLFEVTFNTIIFGSCGYVVTSGESLGDVTEGNPAIFHANAVGQHSSGSGMVCPETIRWTGTYQLTSPASTTLSVSSGSD